MLGTRTFLYRDFSVTWNAMPKDVLKYLKTAKV